MAAYDEDLSENPFFMKFQQECPELFGQCVREGWIICVPRIGSASKSTFASDDEFLHHVLVPVCKEDSHSRYRTLSGKEVKVQANVLTVENDVAAACSAHVLFEETFYTSERHKYSVLCLENSLEASSMGSAAETHFALSSLRDCVDFLWRESGGPKVLEMLDEQVQRFLRIHPDLEEETLQSQRDATGSAYATGIQLALKDQRLREKTVQNKSAMGVLKLAVETYMLHGMYRKLISGITACTAYDDAHLNKIIRNLSDIQLRDLQVRQDLYDAVPYARKELSRIDASTTPIGKIGCIRRAVAAVTSRAQRRDKAAPAVCTDDLLPVLVYVVIKSGIPNWWAHFTFIRDFRFSAPPGDLEENSFYITTLEAALEHVKSGVLLGRSSPEADHDFSECEGGYSSPSLARQFSEGTTTTFSKHIAQFFDLVQQGKVGEIAEILDQPKRGEEKAIATTDLCHPLCACDKCEWILSQSRCEPMATVHSRDDRGFTALHVASLFGQLKVVDMLMELGSHIDATDYRGATPLHYAASRGHQNVLLLLVYAGADINAADNEANTPLHMASMNGHETCVKAILYYTEHIGKPLEINAAGMKGDTALHHAARWGYEGIVEILLDYGANPEIQNGWKMTSLDYAHNIRVSRALAERKPVKTAEEEKTGAPSTPNLDSSMKRLSLSSSSSDGSWTCVGEKEEPVVVGGGDMNQKSMGKLFHSIEVGDFHLCCYYLGVEDEENCSSLEIAGVTRALCHPLCMCDKCALAQKVVKRVIRKDVVRVTDRDAEGVAGLHVAAMHGRVNIARVLLKLGADVNAKTWSTAKIPLHVACEHNQMEVAKLLVMSHSLIDAQDSLGNTPLHYSCVGNFKGISSVLLKNGANFELLNHAGKTPLEVKVSLALANE